MLNILSFVGLALVASWWPTSVWARFGSKLDHDTFRERCRAYRNLDRVNIPPPPVGIVDFYPTGAIEAGQTRFSFKHLRKAMTKATKVRKGAYYDKRLKLWVFSHDDGRSVFPREKSAGSVYYRGRLYLFDGHHKGLTSTYLRAPAMPTLVEADWSYLSPENFRQRMAAGPHHYAHWRDAWGQAVDPVDVCEMENDPNLLLARYLLLRVDVRLGEGGRLVMENLRGAARPILIKINNDIPFFEIEIADALRRHGVVFDENRREVDLSTSELRKYLHILREERDRSGSRLNRILLLDEPRTFGKLNLPQRITDHLVRRECQEFLTAPTRAED